MLGNTHVLSEGESAFLEASISMVLISGNLYSSESNTSRGMSVIGLRPPGLAYQRHREFKSKRIINRYYIRLRKYETMEYYSKYDEPKQSYHPTRPGQEELARPSIDH